MSDVKSRYVTRVAIQWLALYHGLHPERNKSNGEWRIKITPQAWISYYPSARMYEVCEIGCTGRAGRTFNLRNDNETIKTLKIRCRGCSKLHNGKGFDWEDGRCPACVTLHESKPKAVRPLPLYVVPNSVTVQ
jgi:phage FluMu protein Com